MKAGDRATTRRPVRLIGGPPLGNRGSVVWGVAGTLLLHGAIWWLAPDRLPESPVTEPVPKDYLEIYLTDPEEEPVPPEEFVLTNPEVAANPPDETTFFSDRDQQAAQEEASEEGDPAVPDVEGELPDPNQNLVSGEDVSAAAAEAWAEEMARWREEAEAFSAEPLPDRPIPGFEPVEEGEGLEVAVTPENQRAPEETPVIGVELENGERPDDSAEIARADAAEASAPVQPRPRPKLPLTSSGPTGTRRGAAPNLGTIAVDANFSQYGDYLARMLEVIVEQWHILAWEALHSGEVGTVVSVSFRVDASGRIHGLEVLQSTAGLTATLICQDAVSSRQPYGEWPPDMREVLGEEQTIRIRFHYR